MPFLRIARQTSSSLCVIRSQRLVTRYNCSKTTSAEDMAGTQISGNGINVAGMRKAYKAGNQTFVESDLASKDPFDQFAEWFKIACEAPGMGEANAMSLSTATKDGKPSARWVLLKGYDRKGFKFYTNYGSRKAKELIENPFACLVFYWEGLSRSVRIEGSVEKLSQEESTEYFHSRPKESQIGACVSHQSTPIANRDVLTNQLEELKEKYKAPDVVVPKPDYWEVFLWCRLCLSFGRVRATGSMTG